MILGILDANKAIPVAKAEVISHKPAHQRG
jgi:hypothetical protein